ncbi:MAG: hypothetical protein FWG21_04120 [Oscillospiraceae bacterium]|nr:hypothetical protein [Oscillospiraceae bacterium]
MTEKVTNNRILQIFGTLVRVLMFMLTIFSFLFVIVIIYFGWYNPTRQLQQAQQLIELKDYDNAAILLSSIEGYMDVSERLTECYAMNFTSLLLQDRVDEAISLIDTIIDRDEHRYEGLMNDIYEYADNQMNNLQIDRAVFLYTGILQGYMNSDYIYNRYIYETAIIEMELNNLVLAYDILLTVDPVYIPDSIAAIELCQAIVYTAAVEEFYLINSNGDSLTMDIVLPEAFLLPMLEDYEDSWNYCTYASLVGAWSAKSRQSNLMLVYELGDFLNARESGFAMQRLYERRYLNSAGYYFQIDRDGVAQTNIPRYHLTGYYGLYSKIDNGIYYIGSDEVRWTKQFSFIFDDYDKILYVYSYATGIEYLLQRDETPIYA